MDRDAAKPPLLSFYPICRQDWPVPREALRVGVLLFGRRVPKRNGLSLTAFPFEIKKTYISKVVMYSKKKKKTYLLVIKRHGQESIQMSEQLHAREGMAAPWEGVGHSGPRENAGRDGASSEGGARDAGTGGEKGPVTQGRVVRKG
jgi:hypothetical protein